VRIDLQTILSKLLRLAGVTAVAGAFRRPLFVPVPVTVRSRDRRRLRA
jgi:hypothetical protein